MANDTEKRITAKMVLDSTGFNEGLQGVNQQLKVNKSELNNAQVGMQTFGKTSESLKAVQQALSNQIELQSKKVDIYRQSIEKVTEKMQNNISERDRLKTSLDNANKAYDEAIKEYGKESEEAQKAKDAVSKLEEEYTKKQKAVEANAKSINNYTTNMNKANAELTKTQGELNKTTTELNKNNSGWIKASDTLKSGSEHFKTIGEGASSAGNKILGMTAPLVGVGIAAAKVGMDFDSQMSRVKAISGATGEEFQKLNDQAIDLGANTAFSAKEAAEGMENLASAGFSTTEIMQAMPGMLDLAASSGEDLATSSDIAASTLRGFGLAASEAGYVADVLAKNASATNAAVGDTGEAMKYVAPVAHSMGLSLEEVTAAIGEMANAGIKGSSAGTTLRSALTSLASPSKEAAGQIEAMGLKAFDTQGKLLPLNQIIGNLQTSTKGMTDEQKQNAIATIFGQEAMSGMLTLIDAGPQKLTELTASLKNSDGAAKNMATTMQDNAKSSVEQMMGSLETAGIKLEQSFAPTIRKVADTVGTLADKFSNLSPATQTAIVDAVGLTVAVGGTLKVVGGLATSVSSVLSVMGTFSGAMGTAKLATAGVGTAAEVAAGAGGVGGIAGLGAGLGTLVVAAAPWLVAGAAVAGVGYTIYKGMNEQAVPAVNLFADKVNTTSAQIMTDHGMMTTQIENDTVKISDATQKAVGAYIKMDDDVTKTLTNLYVNGTQITDETTKSLMDKYEQMGTQIKAGMDKHYTEEYNTMNSFFQKSKALTDKEEKNALTSLQKNNSDKKSEIDNYEKQIQSIMQTASNNHRALTSDEQEKINSIQEKMRTNAVNSLSQNEIEAKVILDRMESYGNSITAQQASEIISNAEKQRVESIDKANKQYEETKATIEHMRDDTHSITADQADKLIADAERQKNDSISKANELKDGVVGKFKSMNSDILDDVNTTDGSLKTEWEKLKDWFTNNPIIRWITTKTSGDYSDAKVGNNWTGTNYFDGGLTYMNEKGYELYQQPRGTRIYNHDASEALVKQTAEDVATKVANSVLSNSGGSKNGISVVQNIYTPISSPSEVARQTKNNLRELALRW
jgi:phage tail tape measure protein, TP901 family, core region